MKDEHLRINHGGLGVSLGGGHVKILLDRYEGSWTWTVGDHTVVYCITLVWSLFSFNALGSVSPTVFLAQERIRTDGGELPPHLATVMRLPQHKATDAPGLVEKTTEWFLLRLALLISFLFCVSVFFHVLSAYNLFSTAFVLVLRHFARCVL